MKITRRESVSEFKPENVEIQTITVGHLIAAERIAGVAKGMKYLACLASQVCTFDGQKVPTEDVEKLSARDFLSLVSVLENLKQTEGESGK